MILVWILLGAAGLYGFDRLALWMERRGWIYWRKKHGSSGTLGAALLEVQAIFEPSKRHVLEVRRDERSEDEDSGDPPTP